MQTGGCSRPEQILLMRLAAMKEVILEILEVKYSLYKV
jgi:hypothetical protein